MIARDEDDTHYNIEMQVLEKKALNRRSRYYHSQIDMELLLKGLEYSKLPNTYVIFICDFDPCGQEKYCYTFSNYCEEVEGLKLGDGNTTILLSTCGKNTQDVSERLVKFLRFVRANLKDSQKDFKDEFVKQLQEAVARVKASREMGERYMLLEELLQDEREEGRAEGRLEGQKLLLLELLEEFGEVAAWLRERINHETDLKTLKKLVKEAARTGSMEEFLTVSQIREED